MSIYSFKKWQRLTRIFDKKIEMQTTTKKVSGGDGREEKGRAKYQGAMTRVEKENCGTLNKLDIEARKNGSTRKRIFLSLSLPLC